MTRIGQADHILFLLREQLQRSAEGRARTAAQKSGAADAVQGGPLDRIRTLAAFDAIDPEERRRLVIRTLLLEEFGESLGDDPAFASVIDRVCAMVQDTAGGTELVDRAILQLAQNP